MNDIIITRRTIGMYSNKYVNIFQEDRSRHVMLYCPQQTKQRFGTNNLCTLHGSALRVV